MKKILLGLVVLVLLAAGGGAWWLYSERDSLIADAIRTYGPQILGVPVDMISVGPERDQAIVTRDIFGSTL